MREVKFMLSLLFISASGAQVAKGSIPSDSHYVAAVVDYAPAFATGLSGEENIMRNIRAFDGLMGNASAQNADIIVFPEIGLIGFGNAPFYTEVPDPQASMNPCSKDPHDFSLPLRNLSCLARKHQMYLVVNLLELSNCTLDDTECPPSGAYHYNTNVVFDRSGIVIARYRKWNLYNHSDTQKPPALEYVTFDTDFGVKFGTFTCFDIDFEKPAVVLARDMGVTDFVFPTAWYSEVPFLTAIQIQTSWAHAMDVNFLASGCNYPPTGTGGSGIYRGKNGPLETVFSGVTGLSTLLVQFVPKKGHWPEGDAVTDPSLFEPILTYQGEDPYQEMQAVKMLVDHYHQFTTQLLDRPPIGQEVDVQEQLCSHGLCCDFRVTARGLNPFTMVSAAASVHRPFHDIFLFSADSKSAFNLTDVEDKFDGFYYRLAVFQGVRDYSGQATGGVQLCSIISCLNEELESCGYISKGMTSPLLTWTEFTNITISGRFTGGRFYMPDTEIGPRYKTLSPSSFYWDSQSDVDENHFIRMHLQRSVTDLRTFAIYGRVFDWDGNQPT